MIKRLAVLAAVMSVVGIASCGREYREYTDTAVANASVPRELPVYSKDPRTDLCFASQYGSGDNSRTFTNVPCTVGVERMIRNYADSERQRLTPR